MRRSHSSPPLDPNTLPALVAIVLFGVDAITWAYLGHPWIAIGFGLAMLATFQIARWGTK